MLEIYVILFTFIVTIVSNLISKKNQFLVDKKFSSHKSFITKELSPITGGFIFLISILFFLTFDNQYLKFFLFSIFVIGFLSDTNYLFSPLKRFSLQIFIVILFIYFNQTFIESVRIQFLDDLLQNVYFKYFLTLFCFLVLMNGSNFMDGVNGLLLGYFLILLIVCAVSIKKFGLNFDVQNFRVMIIVLGIILIFNLFGKLLTGDSGAYSISFIIGFSLIALVNLTDKVSPYFVACLLWYPAYECLFSIIRKKIIKKSITDPDNKHLHHLIFIYFKRKLKLKGIFLNTFTGLSINLFNLLIFYGAFENISQTKNLIFLNVLCLLTYNLIYFYLNKILK